jgi:hypothetical protein
VESPLPDPVANGELVTGKLVEVAGGGSDSDDVQVAPMVVVMSEAGRRNGCCH